MVKRKNKESKKSIPKKIKQLVWNKYIGEKNGVGVCLCCNTTEISQMNFQCGHIISEYNGGDVTLDNLIPICSLCNTSMGKMNMDDFIKKHGLDKNNEKSDRHKLKTKSIIDNKIDSELEKYLNNLTLKKLKQLCLSISHIKKTDNISPNGKKEKVVKKIMNICTLNEIMSFINENKDKRYFVKCYGDNTKHCNECFLFEENDYIQCEKCDNSHTYYTNDKTSDNVDKLKNNYIFITKESGKKCKNCNCITSMDEYENEFYEAK
jgi:hypothetical protein